MARARHRGPRALRRRARVGCLQPEGGGRLGRVLKLAHDGDDRVPIERSLVVDSVLKHSLRRLRSVKSQRPPTADSVEFADWQEEVADALDALACVLVFEDDRIRAGAEAAAAREHAAEIRCRCGGGAGEH